MAKTNIATWPNYYFLRVEEVACMTIKSFIYALSNS